MKDSYFLNWWVRNTVPIELRANIFSPVSSNKLSIANSAPGSIIVSDCWAAYESIPDMVIDAGYGYEMPLYEHEAVNHERGFVGSDGRHSNTIEGTWYAVKRACPVKKRNKSWIPGCLFQFMWRRVNEGNLWNALIRALVDIRYE